MSYYNDDDHKELTPLQERLKQDELQKQHRTNKKQGGGSKTGYFISALSGIIVGALLMWLLLPSAIQTQQTNSNATTNNSPSAITQTATEVTTDVTKAIEQVSEAVVGITNIQQISNFWNQAVTEQEAGNGSGVIYKIDGNKAFIVTNYHVIENAKQLEVTLADGSKKEAELIGGDIWTDLAVISIDSKDISTVAKFGDSDVLKQGETVIAIGNPLGLEFYGSVTKGIVSGTDRTVPVDLDNDGTEDWQTEVLQTDAAINPGNSGGALINIVGELIGINSMKIAESSVEGLGFSIPINAVIPVIEELEQSGEVQRPMMGVSLIDLAEVPSFYQYQTLQMPEEVTTGVVVSEVVRNSSADQAGMKQYDVIVEMDGQKIESAMELRKHLYNEKEVGDTLNIKVYRQGKLMELQLELVNNSAV